MLPLCYGGEMLLAIFTTFACPQGPAELPTLSPGTVISGELNVKSKRVSSEKMAKIAKGEPSRGMDFSVLLSEEGRFRIELSSPAFDTYLILRDGDGKILTEDDDGGILTNSRIFGKWQANKPYVVTVCTLQGYSGPFEVKMIEGKAPSLSRAKQMQAIEKEHLKRVDYYENFYGPDHVKLSDRLNDLGNHYLDTGDNAKARDAFRRCLEIREARPASSDDLTVIALNNLGRSLTSTGPLSEAREVQLRGVKMAQEVCGEEHHLTGVAYSNYGSILEEQGLLEQAMEYKKRALAVTQKIHGDNHPSTARSLNNLAYSYLMARDLQRAMPLVEQAYQILLKSSGDKHPETIMVALNLAQVMLDQGMVEDALPLIESVVAITQGEFGEFHPSTNTALVLLARVEGMSGDLSSAHDHLQRALTINRALYGPEASATTLTMATLGLLFDQMRDHSKAEEIHQQVLDILKKKRSGSEEGYLMALGNVAISKALGGDPQGALPLLEEAFTHAKEVLGTKHETTFLIQYRLGEMHGELGDYQAAFPHFFEALRHSIEKMETELPSMTEAMRFRLLSAGHGPGDLLHTYPQAADVSPVDTYQLFLRWKGMSTRMQLAGKVLTRNSNDEWVMEVMAQIAAAAKAVAQLVAERHGDEAQRQQRIARLQELRRKRMELEQQLNRHFNLDTVMSVPTVGELQSALPEDAMLLDFFVEERVYVWLLQVDKEPVLIDLGSAEAMNRAMLDYLQFEVGLNIDDALNVASRGARSLGGGKAKENLSAQLSELLWQPLSKHVHHSSTLFVSPDSFLCKLPFGILPRQEGGYLIEKYAFHYLSDATQLTEHVAQKIDESRMGPVLAVGSVDYGQTQWLALPATQNEVDSIRALHTTQLKWSSQFQSLTGKAADKESVRDAMPGKRYLHLATHGFFEPESLPSLGADAERLRMAGQLGTASEAVGLLPGLLAGLILSPANEGQALAAQSLESRSQLTAEEIQHLDLSACELAVLSACETALGSARAGEGLMSLRRAFRVAGARAVLSSLWKVEDQATAELMANFYRNYWQLGMSKGEALRQAKLKMIRNTDQTPFGKASLKLWGPFVLSGQWN